MKDRLMIRAAMVSAMALVVGTAAAQVVTVNNNTGSYSYGQGGEFAAAGVPLYAQYGGLYAGVAKNVDTTYGNSFQVFCIQTSVEFSPGTQYRYTVSPPANPVETISWGAAWLYSQFASGHLASYGYTYATGTGRTQSAADLQLAIWYLQGQTTLASQGNSGAGFTGTGYNGLLGADVGYSMGTRNGTAFYNDAFAAATAAGVSVTSAANGAFGVGDLELWNSNGTQAQNQLMMVPEPTTLVAGMLLLLPFGASTLRFARRNRSAV